MTSSQPPLLLLVTREVVDNRPKYRNKSKTEPCISISCPSNQIYCLGSHLGKSTIKQRIPRLNIAVLEGIRLDCQNKTPREWTSLSGVPRSAGALLCCTSQAHRLATEHPQRLPRSSCAPACRRCAASTCPRAREQTESQQD